MKKQYSIQELRELCFGAEIFPAEVLQWIENNNLWNLWVPKNYGGLELSFSGGLKRLKELASIDGSLGWTVTLCSGANYFIGNLKPEISEEIFLEPRTPVCFGGSGGVSGTAEKKGKHYRVSGLWRYATGAPYLTHFTLNAKILENGKEIISKDGSPLIRSFILPREDVEIIEDWDTMGLKATATYSFEVKDKSVHEDYSFIYNQFHLPHPIFKINFALFADLTLWVNYLGMAEHFLAEASQSLKSGKIKVPEESISEASRQIFEYAEAIEKTIATNSGLTKSFNEEVHRQAISSVEHLSKILIDIYPNLGVKAARRSHQLNQIFRDYFTATQHHIFSK